MNQSKINASVDGYNALCQMILHSRPLEWGEFTVGGVRGERLTAALDWCVANEYAQYAQESYLITTVGRVYCEEAKGNPKIQVSNYQSWKDEALTGIDTKGQRSKITKAALPRSSADFTTSTGAEKVLLDIERQRQATKEAAKLVGLDVDKFKELNSAGLIRVCKGGGEAHLGRFHKGQTMCAKCKKGKRK